MSKLTLLVCLTDFPTENLLNSGLKTGRHAIEVCEGNDHGSILERDGVTRLSDNAFLFDTTKAHGAFVLVCKALSDKGHAYLLSQLETEDAVLVAGLKKEALKHLEKIGLHPQN